MTRKLVTSYIHPPIPYRGFDWMVYDENEAEQPTVVGWGVTEWEAIRDYADGLRDANEEERREQELPAAFPANIGKS